MLFVVNVIIADVLSV